MSENVLVFGGTGNYGKYIVRSLVENKIPVKVFTRDRVRARSMLGNKPEFFEGNVLIREDVKESMKNTKAIIISLSALHPKLIRKLKAIELDAVMTILDEAKEASIQRIIYISIYDMNKELIEKLKLEVGLFKMTIENRLKNSDFNWTILGCPPSFQIFTSFTRKNSLIVPGGGSPLMPSVAPQDVGEIAAQASIRNDLSGKRLHMTYSEPFSFPDVAQRFSELLGRKIKYRKIPLFGLKIASILSYPFNPYLHHLVKYVGLLNNFPIEYSEYVPIDHQILLDLFEYQPLTLEEYANGIFQKK
ncbi:MAG: NAD-dependent epimerase/dehydratase family protein [Candidatus Heimdallarchaeota archaeon]|nr:NAD-dependent epimerase/dehydratase family protein [Candidatus Heimdallarchaeota archaeon]